ncbi:MAG: hypothetical protein IJT97_03850 [Bacteroidaceae bacterium]|nr:hypothetical protein [Bacteroidaceae bacterium]
MPKRVGNLMPRIASLDNLHEAFLRAARGKAGKMAVVDFRNHLDENLLRIQRQLLDGTFRFGHYQFFVIHDPKRRTICAASFPERVVFHAMMRICHPVFDDYQIFDSYASRIGKGTYKALDRACQFARRYEWFAKIDACKYFDSISHEVMLSQLSRLFKDAQLLIFFRNLLDTYAAQPGRGLPIGNLTSQYFANHYLSVGDHYLKEELRVPAVVRYMDDVLLLAHSKEELQEWVSKYCRYLQTCLRLDVHVPVLNRTRFGIPFLGYVVYGDGLRLNRRSKLRFEQKMFELSTLAQQQEIDENEYASRAGCLVAFINKAHVGGFRQQMGQKKGVYLQGL